MLRSIVLDDDDDNEEYDLQAAPAAHSRKFRAKLTRLGLCRYDSIAFQRTCCRRAPTWHFAVAGHQQHDRDDNNNDDGDDAKYPLDEKDEAIQAVPPDFAFLTAKLVELGEVAALSVMPKFYQDLDADEFEQRFLAEFSDFFAAIRESKVKINNLILSVEDPSERLNREILKNLIPNTSVRTLTLTGSEDVDLATVQQFLSLLTQRKAKLSLKVYGRAVWFGAKGTANNVRFNGPTLHDFQCLHEGLLEFQRVLPVNLLPDHDNAATPTKIRVKCLKMLNMNDAGAHQVFQFLAANQVESLSVHSNGPFSGRGLFFERRPCDAMIRYGAPLFRDSGGRLWDADDGKLEAFPSLVPNVRAALEPLVSNQVALLTKRLDLWPSLSSVAIDDSAIAELPPFLAARPSITELRLHFSGAAEAQPTPSQIEAFAEQLAASNIIRLITISLDLPPYAFEWLQTILRHPACKVQLLWLYGRINSHVSEVHKVLLSSHSLRVVATFFLNKFDNAILHQAVLAKPQILAISPIVGPSAEDNPPADFAALMKMQTRGDCCEIMRRYCAVRAVLRDRQIGFVLHRDAWQRAAFTIAWWRANLNNALRDSCFALLPDLRALLGSAASGFEFGEHEQLECDDPVPQMWYLNDATEAAALFKARQLNAQRLVDSLFGRNVIAAGSGGSR